MFELIPEPALAWRACEWTLTASHACSEMSYQYDHGQTEMCAVNETKEHHWYIYWMSDSPVVRLAEASTGHCGNSNSRQQEEVDSGSADMYIS